MHICHVTSALAGGPATSISMLSKRQVEAGYTVSLVYSSTRDQIWSHRKRFDHLAAAIPWRVRRPIGLHDIGAFLELRRILDELRPDIVHLHCSKAGALGRPIARALGIPCLYSSHGVSFARTDNSFRAMIYRTLERLLARGGEPLVACSETEAEYLRLVSRSVHVVPNGVALEALEWARSQAHRGDCRFTIGILGLIKDQRQPALVRKLVLQAPAAWRWIWVGDGVLRPVVEGLTNLEVTGWCQPEEAWRRIAAVDVVLHASRWEGMPYALLEAMGLGKAVVASNVVGTRDVVTHEVDGLLVDKVYATEPYLAALERLAADGGLRDRLGRAARERIARDHDPDRLFGMWETIYALARSQRRPARVSRPAATGGSDWLRAPF